MDSDKNQLKLNKGCGFLLGQKVDRKSITTSYTFSSQCYPKIDNKMDMNWLENSRNIDEGKAACEWDYKSLQA